MKQFGTRIHTVLTGCRVVEDIGEYFGADIYECEVRYFMKFEWALYPDDYLFRRTRQGLKANNSTREALKLFMDNYDLSRPEFHVTQLPDAREA